MASGSVTVATRPGALRTCTLHSLPCRIHHDGPALVDSWFHQFDPQPRAPVGGQAPEREATLRGRLLTGVRVDLPTDTQGWVLAEGQEHGADFMHASFDQAEGEGAEEASRTLLIKAEFGHVMCWNHDLPHTHRDFVPAALEWIPIARALHVDDEDEVNAAP